MTGKTISKLSNYFFLASAILLLIYTGYRGFVLSFTHDESYSFNHYVHSSVLDIISYNLSPVIANSHTLNTLCMKWFGTLFGNSDFVLRLQSIIAHALYLIFTFLLLKEVKSKFILIAGFILLNFNPYLLDFFSLARGYALSISLMVASIYFFWRFISDQKILHLFYCFAISVLAVLANYSLITFAAALILVTEFYLFINRYTLKQILKCNVPLFMAFLLLIWTYFGPIKVLTNHNQLGFGGHQGIWFDTVISSICSYLYSTSYFDIFIILLRFLVVFTSIGSVIVIYKQIKSYSLNPFSYITLILFIVFFASKFQAIFLNGSYFRDRFALFLVPLFFFSFLNVIIFCMQQNKFVKVFGYTVSIAAVCCALSIFQSSVNFTHSKDWRYDADTKTMLKDVTIVKGNNNNVRIGITWLFEPTINFYRDTKNLQWLSPVNRDGVNGDYDFYYVEPGDFGIFDVANKILIKEYPVSGSRLYKRVY